MKQTTYRYSEKKKETKTVLVHRYIGRNEPCPCGSGVKFKKCCIENIYGDPRSQEKERIELRNLVKLKKAQNDPDLKSLNDFING